MPNDIQEMTRHLQKRTGNVLCSADMALHWFEDNPKAIRGDGDAVKYTLRRFRRQARQLDNAAYQPPAVAVFGASQAGKSYLVSSLATKPGQALIAYYQKENLNFLTDMNPQGGNESTGLVSRFTTRKIDVIDEDMPVPLRLLSAVDVIKILTNTSIEDFKIKDAEIDDQSLQNLFHSMKPFMQDKIINSIIDIDDIEVLYEYLKKQYPDHHRFEKLREIYWQQLRETVPYIPAHESAVLFSPLWNNLGQFTNLGRNLFTVLGNLGKTENVYCSTEALKPREKSILNVETLFTLGMNSQDKITVLTSKGERQSIDRSIVTALTAELTVPIGSDASWAFLKETDLLDFPGARSREMIYDPQAFLQAPEALGRLFLRGKVAYLFQRYEAEREISAMLLCIGDSIQNVSTLPGMIDGWVKNSIGATEEERNKQRDNLFVVLTKFDREFEQKAGESPSSSTRWTARINASLIDFFKTCSWIENWRDNHPFNNLYWLRSPSISFPAVMDYTVVNGHKEEAGIAERAKNLVETMKQAYLSNPEIKRYVADPEKAWNAVLQPNDGGITYLAGALGKVCDARLKVEQINGQIEHLAVNLARFISPYYHSGNTEEAIKKASSEAQSIALSLMQSVKSQMFGSLLRSLQVRREDMMEAWHSMEMQLSNQRLLIGRTSDVDDLFQDMFPDADLSDQKQEKEVDTGQAKDRHEQYADLVLSKWNHIMDDFSRNDQVEQHFYISTEQLTALTAEISLLARRLNLRDRLAEQLRRNAALFTSGSLKGETQVLLAEMEIGNFVYYLGYHSVPLSERPMTRGLKGEHHVFEPREAPNDILILPEHPVPYHERFVRDWISAMVQRFEENAGASSLDGIDPAANEALGRIITVLKGL